MLSAVAGARSRNIVFRVVACNKVGVLQECAKSLLVYCYGGGGVNSQAEMGFSQMFQTPQLAAAAVTCWRFQLNAVPSSAQGVQQPLSPSPCAVSSSGSASVVRPHACCQIAVLGNKVQNIHINLSNPPLPIVRPPPEFHQKNRTLSSRPNTKPAASHPNIHFTHLHRHGETRFSGGRLAAVINVLVRGRVSR